MKSSSKDHSVDLLAIEARARQLRANWIRDLFAGKKAR